MTELMFSISRTDIESEEMIERKRICELFVTGYNELRSRGDHYAAFVLGLSKFGVTYDELGTKYKYIGGTDDVGRRRLISDGYDPSSFDVLNECVCGHFIVQNCYMANKNGDYLIIGSCCIKRYVDRDAMKLKCKNCGKVHRNWKKMLCNDCK